MNFNALGLKSLTATCYAYSCVAGKEIDLFTPKTKTPHKIVITEVGDVNGDGRIDLADVEWLIKNDKNVLTKLKGDGDFRSAECVELLKQAVVERRSHGRFELPDAVSHMQPQEERRVNMI